MKLQNHFTTIEQSKRLLELGVPANSADCYMNDEGVVRVLMDGRTFEQETSMLEIVGVNDLTPCWSVGRLIEIADIFSVMYVNTWTFDERENYIDRIIEYYKTLIKDGCNFSKLNDWL